MQFSIVILLIFTRVICVVMTAPILGSRVVPIKMRLVLSAFISMAALPLAVSTTSIDATPAAIVTAVSSELVIGIALGLGVTILFAAAQAVGAILGQLAGVEWPTQTDVEAGDSVSAVSKLFAMLSLAAFALIGGPELVLGAMLETCVHLPLGTSLNSSDMVALIAELLQQSFVLTLRGVGPAVAALLISTIVIGFIGRAYPQVNLLGLAINANQFILLLAIFLTMGGCVWLFADDLSEFVVLIQTRLRDMG